MAKALSKLDIIKAGKNASIMMRPATVEVFQPKLSRPRNIEDAERIFQECKDDLYGIISQSALVHRYDGIGELSDVMALRKAKNKLPARNYDDILSSINSERVPSSISKYEFGYDSYDLTDNFSLYFKERYKVHDDSQNDIETPNGHRVKDGMVPGIRCVIESKPVVMINGEETNYVVEPSDINFRCKGYVLLDGKTDVEIQSTIDDLNIFCDKSNVRKLDRGGHTFLQIPMSPGTAQIMMENDMLIGYTFSSKDFGSDSYSTNVRLHSSISSDFNSAYWNLLQEMTDRPYSNDIKLLNYNLKCAFGSTYGKDTTVAPKSGLIPVWDVTMKDAYRWGEQLSSHAADISSYVMEKLGLPDDGKQHIYINQKTSVTPDKKERPVDFVAWVGINAPREKVASAILEAIDDVSSGKYRVCANTKNNLKDSIHAMRKADVANAIAIVKEQQSKIVVPEQPMNNTSLNELLIASQPTASTQMGD